MNFDSTSAVIGYISDNEARNSHGRKLLTFYPKTYIRSFGALGQFNRYPFNPCCHSAFLSSISGFVPEALLAFMDFDTCSVVAHGEGPSGSNDFSLTGGIISYSKLTFPEGTG